MSLENLSKRMESEQVTGMTEYHRALRTVTLAEIRELAEVNKDHPYHKHVQEIVDTWKNSGGDREFLMDKEIVQGIIENREIQEVTEYIDGRAHCTLHLSEKRKEEKVNGAE